MNTIREKPLSDDLPFGARVTGVNIENLRDADTRDRINLIFHDRGMIVFENMEPSNRLQVELSKVFGLLQGHALDVSEVEGDDAVPGMVDFDSRPEDTDIFEVNGKELSNYIPWHFDACYTRELNRGGVLRALVVPPEGGETGFADGIQIYQGISPELRATFRDLNIIYNSNLMFQKMRFGRPESYHPVRTGKHADYLLTQTEGATRAIHPAIWQRESGEKVLHVSPWQADGIEGREGRDGDELLEALCREMYACMTPYFHAWKTTDMVIWDNWRFIHSACGNDPGYTRRMHRTTIKGDYGLGHFEGDREQKP